MIFPVAPEKAHCVILSAAKNLDCMVTVILPRKDDLMASAWLQE